MNHSVARFIQPFFSHYLLEQRGLSPNSILAYRDAIKLLLGYAADTLKKKVDALDVEDLDASRVLAFLDSLESQRGSRPATRNARLAALRIFFGYVAREEPSLIPQAQTLRAIPLKRTEHPSIGYLEEREIQSLLNAVNVGSRTGIRDRALLLLFYNTGARVSEIVHLKITHLRLDGTPQVQLLGKGKKHRSCPLWPETAASLQTYLDLRGAQDPSLQQLFLNARSVPITRFGLRHIIRKYATQAQAAAPFVNTQTVNPHTLRHTTAMHLLRAGNDVNMVSYWLGHADINTTHIYLEIDMEMKRRMLQKIEPPLLRRALPWKKPDILAWLNNLAKTPELCAVAAQPKPPI